MLLISAFWRSKKVVQVVQIGGGRGVGGGGGRQFGQNPKDEQVFS